MTTLFHAIADGSDRLRFGEDALIWRLRAEGLDWPEVEAALLKRRAAWVARGHHIAAVRWRDQLRRERAAG